MLVLAARIPVIDRVFGHDRAMATHRSLGKPAIYLILGHAVLLIVGYGISSGVNPFAEIASNVEHAGHAARLYRNRAPAPGGRHLTRGRATQIQVRVLVRHPSAQLRAVLTALPHQLSVGGMLAVGTGQRVYWIALYVLALGSIVAFRFVEPLVK